MYLTDLPAQGLMLVVAGVFMIWPNLPLRAGPFNYKARLLLYDQAFAGHSGRIL